MRYYLLLFVLAVSVRVSAQDSITVVQYNLLNYGNYTEYCTNSNNNHVTKEGYLRTIIDYAKPQIFTVNEITSLNFYHDRLLTEVMNTNGRGYFKRTPATNYAGSDIINMMFYDTTRLALHSMAVVQSYIRDINLYRLYYKTSNLTHGDTIFINCIVAHLKASDGIVNADIRAEMAANVMDWLTEKAKPGNYLLMGDLNLYTAEEEAYHNFTGSSGGSFQFYDPVNTPGDWNNNPSFASVHTQSVTASGNGCQASGGMDDRFDFILATDEIMEGSHKVKYVPGSYKAIGQDGKHYNTSITLLPNNSVPSDVLTALGKMSDHLPVTMKLEIKTEEPGAIAESMQFKNPVFTKISKSEAIISFTQTNPSLLDINILNSAGQLIAAKQSMSISGFNKMSLSIGDLKDGFYLVNIHNKYGDQITFKLIK